MNKGFTLVELLIVIGLLALLMFLVATNIVGIQGNNQDKEYDNFVSTIEDAACVYIERTENQIDKQECQNDNSSNSCKISIQKLVTEGLLSEELTNPKNDKNITEYNNEVIVSYTDNIKSCNFEEE